MRTRSRLILAFAGAHLVLALVLALVAWAWLDAALRAEAEQSARAVGRVLAQGGFSLTPGIVERMHELSGHRFAILQAGAAAPDGWIVVGEGGRTIAVEYRTEGFHAARHQLVVAAASVACFGTLVFAALAWWLAGRFASPIERLAASARTLAAALDQPVPQVGHGEVAELARELERTRLRLVVLGEDVRRGERLKTLGTFAASVAHEVRNPLTSLRLAAQVLASSLAGREHGDPAATRLVEEIDRLDLVVDGLTGFARGFAVRPEPLDLAEPVADVLRLLARQARHAGVTLTASGSARVAGDPQRLRQLVLNLAVNAIQACQGREPATVTIEICSDGLAVIDDGPGVEATVAERLFQPFASSRPEGIGLGLHIAQAIAQAHGAMLHHQPRHPGSAFILAGLAPADQPGSTWPPATATT